MLSLSYRFAFSATNCAGEVVSTSMAACPELIRYAAVNSNACAAPLECIDSASTSPVNLPSSAGWRTTGLVTGADNVGSATAVGTLGMPSISGSGRGPPKPDGG